MKALVQRRSNYVIVVVVGALMAVLSGFISKQSVTNSASIVPSAKNRVQLYISTGLESLIDKSENFNRQLFQCGDANCFKAVQDSFSALRMAYKRIEPILHYTAFTEVKWHINGAPLPRVAGGEGRDAMEIIPPQGLQRMDELIWSPNPLDQKGPLLQLNVQLLKRLKTLQQHLFATELTDQVIFEALRMEVIAVYTLGITGFDTPGSKNGWQESIWTLKSINALLAEYLGEERIVQSSLFQTIEKKLALFDAQLKLKQDTPDAIAFYKEVIRPYLTLLHGMQTSLEIPFPLDFRYTNTAINHRATELFSIDFFQLPFFTKVIPSASDDKKLALGELLFFDPVLSSNNKRACASCHVPSKAFTDGRKLSLAYDGVSTVQRNAPTLVNSILATKFFYDVRAKNAQSQVRKVVEEHAEFRTSFSEIKQKLHKSAAYKEMFKDAYPNRKGEISQFTISEVIVLYLASLTEFDSPFDEFMRDERTRLDKDVKDGFNLFMGKAACATCHFAPSFAGIVPPYYRETETEVLGVPSQPDTVHAVVNKDLGRAKSGLLREDIPLYEHAFKTPTVRNIRYTAPYMHNGVYQQLEEVIDFYNRGGGAGIGIHLENQTLASESLDLSLQEQQALIAFLEHLSSPAKHLKVKPRKLPSFGKGHPFNKRIWGGAY